MEKEKHIAKVLIIGQNFNNTTGGGITLSNLFSSYSKDKIAVVTSFKNSNLEYCERVYVLGRRETKYFLCTPKTKSRYEAVIDKEIRVPPKKGFYSFANHVSHFVNLAILGGVCKLAKVLFRKHCSRYSFISCRLHKWIESFNPEIIYTQLGSVQQILFFEQLRQRYVKPFVIHFMDDWFQKFPEFKPDGALYPLVFKQIQEATLLLAICAEMAKEYENRFSRRFYAFHNPVDIEKWGRNTKSDWSKKGNSFTILFAGNLDEKGDEYNELCKAIHALNRDLGYQISFHIFTNDVMSPEAERLRKYKEVKIFSFIPNHLIGERLKHADLLLLLLSLDDDFVRRTNLSMPTKTSEYMASGTPILVYAHAESALNKYASEYGWGYVVSERNQETLKKAIFELYNNENLRRKLGERSSAVANARHNIVTVSNDFAQHLNDSLENNA